MPSPTLRSVLRAALHHLLADLAALSPEEAADAIADDDWKVKITLEPMGGSSPRGPSVPVVPDGLNKVERKAWLAAEATPLPVKALARKAGYPNGSYFSAAITSLVRRKLLVRMPEGLRRA